MEQKPPALIDRIRLLTGRGVNTIQLVLATLTCCLVLTNAFGQEEQVHMDLHGNIFSIDAELEQKIQVFPEYENFREAMLFMKKDSTYVLEVTYRADERIFQNREELTAGEVDTLRNTITNQVSRKAPKVNLNQEGRARLLISNTVTALSYYGLVTPAVLNVSDPVGVGGLYLLTSGTGFFVPFLLTKNAEVTHPMATLSSYGQQRGIIHGMALSGLLFGNPTSQQLLGTGMLMSIGEGIGGYMLADRLELRTGEAATIGVMGDFGLGFGAGTARLAGFTSGTLPNRGIGISALLGAGAGMLGGRMLTKRQRYTRGDAQLLQTTGLLGAYWPLTMASAAQVTNTNTIIGLAMGGAAGGLAVGHFMTRGYNFTNGEGLIISVGAVAGGCLGLGTGFLLAGDADPTTILVSGGIGATGGLGLMYSIYANSGSKAGKQAQSALDINLKPAASLGFVGMNKQQPYDATPMLNFQIDMHKLFGGE